MDSAAIEMQFKSEKGIHKLYQDSIAANRCQIIRLIHSFPEVIEKLLKLNGLDKEETALINHTPFRTTQKEIFLYMLSSKGYYNIAILIQVFRETKNKEVETIFRNIDNDLQKTFPNYYNPREPPDWSTRSGKTFTLSIRNDKEIENSDSLWRFLKYAFRMRSEISHVDIERTTACVKCNNNWKFHKAISDGDLELFRTLVEAERDTVAILRPCHECTKILAGRTILHAAVSAKKSSDATKFIKVLFETMELTKINLTSFQLFCNKQDELGQTAVHLAVQEKRVNVIQQLCYNYNCDIVIRDNTGDTALDLMMQHTPEFVWDMLRNDVCTMDRVDGNNYVDGDFELEIDFGKIIGHPRQSRKQNRTSYPEAKNYTEMRTLAKLHETKKEESYDFLSHVLILLFFNLKWQRLKPFLWLYTCFKVLLYVWYTVFVIDVFLVRCPMSSPVNISHEKAGASVNYVRGRTFWTYAFGSWGSTKVSPKLTCDLSHDWQTVAFFLIGILFLIKDVFECLMLRRGSGTRYIAVVAYFRETHHWFKMLFHVLMTVIGTLVFQNNIPDASYSYAAVSIMLVWSLAFAEVTYLLGYGVYVKILAKVLWRFIALVANYLCLIIAFSVALSITLPQEQSFEILPQSVLRVIVLLTGELNYDETFYGVKNQNRNTNTQDNAEHIWSLRFTAQVIYVCLTLFLTIVLGNIFIGLAVVDVKELLRKSQVVSWACLIRKMDHMETALLNLKKLFPCLDEYIFVVQQKDPGVMNERTKELPKRLGLMFNISNKEIPQELIPEIRTFVSDSSNYKYTNVNKK